MVLNAADEAARFADESDELARAINNLAEQNRGWREALAGGFGKMAGDQPSRLAEKTITKPVGALGKTTIGVAGLGAGGYAAGEYMQSRQEKFEAMNKQEQREAIAQIMQDPNLNEEEKRGLIDDLRSEGFFSSGDSGSSDGSVLGNIIGDPFGNLGFMQWIVVLIVLYFVGQAVVAHAGSGSGGS